MLRREVGEIGALLGCYAEYGGRDNLAVPSSRVKKSTMSQGNQGFLKPGMLEPTICPETSVKNYHHTLHNMPEECISHMRDVL